MIVMKQNTLYVAILFLAFAVIALCALQWRASKMVVLTPAPDNKTEQAYRRSGFGDRIMTAERRKTLSACYKTMLRSNGYDENKPTPYLLQLSESNAFINSGSSAVSSVRSKLQIT